jgi:hypothetical protein
VHGIEIEAAARKQVCERQAFRRGSRMQWEVDPFEVDIEVPLQVFNTPGTEIAPGSNEVREHF